MGLSMGAALPCGRGAMCPMHYFAHRHFSFSHQGRRIRVRIGTSKDSPAFFVDWP